MVQARSAFGFSGTRFPGLVRAVPAIVWYGFQSWVGAGALNAVSATLFGYDNLVLFFILFQFAQIGLSVLGFQGIKWLENIGAVFILGALIYMFFSSSAASAPRSPRTSSTSRAPGACRSGARRCCSSASIPR
jgi:nucleobase:cation symporter-1, NCS1 family